MTIMAILSTISETIKTTYVTGFSALVPIIVSVAMVFAGWVLVNMIPADIFTKKEEAED